ncbi:TetR/AcrR family transcriptional regulator [Novosphingobium lentum]|uniref:TetR/AcrR family transcriptional regulator n=1 Tax=Novosphingobium lentum TaxID=145287 RepID=UPI0008351A22|nr:TetR/AcrR family transcriptional regulator [Novosphingobium lentum]
MEEDISVAAAPGRRELRKQDRRDAILRAARESFLKNGYAGTSMSGLLTTLGGSKATLWSYFRSKEELFAAVVEDTTGEFQTELTGLLRSSEGLTLGLVAFCRAFLRKIQSPDGLATWRMVVAESGRFPVVGRIFYERAVSLTEGNLIGFLVRHIASGELLDEDPQHMANFVLALCTGRQNRVIWGVEQSDPTRLAVDADQVTAMFLRSFAASQNTL